MTAEPTITLTVARYQPDSDAEPRWQSYTIPYREDMVVLDALNYIKNYVDGSLSYRWSCRMGICGSCGMTVNGVPTLTCASFVRDFYPHEVVVEPLASFPVIRDLVIDMSDFMHKLSAVKPWIIREREKPLSEGAYLQTPAQLDEYDQYSACINCMLCYAACPVYAMDQEFLGPAAIALGRRYNLDSRDQGRIERLQVLANNQGVWDCTFVGECSVVCPKNVDPAKAIQQTKFDTTVEWYKNLLLPWTRR
ncbi:MAG: succinate dehydrogenase/fumarate reductase iron-sulfur subunit [Chloroflexi bacterium]|jgi:fumarate reductase iron-sulfur subunit|nr:succinate dehydrogenase/fumarate reductase iron-sulfur subunit [Chloroflexota bacterium]MDQ2831541.1 succinate dehydrogenase/fumarate reductase iron-sulfur subunit [Chloroflexota bacterium]